MVEAERPGISTMNYLLVALGGSVGAMARYGIGTWVRGGTAGAFPWSTLAINVGGSFLLAFLYPWIEAGSYAVQWRAFLGIGVLGAFTTFSAFSWETMTLIQSGHAGRAALYAAASVLFSLAAAFAGFALATTLRS